MNSINQQIINNINIISIISKYINLKKLGKNYIGLCPFHNENSPSFTINEEKKFFYCFGCKIHGTIINFLMNYFNFSYKEVIKNLVEEYNLNYTLFSNKKFNKNYLIKDILNNLSLFYNKQLNFNINAINFLKKRIIKNITILKFNIGYSPNKINYNFDKKKLNILKKIGLIYKKKSIIFFYFKNRIIFPIKDFYGDVIGFGGRIINNNKKYPKYINSCNSLIFNKSKTLYGLFEAKKEIKKKGYIIVTEGYIDVLSLVQNGFLNTVAILGTFLSKYHIKKLFDLSNNIIFIFDGDKAGNKAYLDILNIFITYKLDNKLIKFVFLPLNFDPDNYIKKYGTISLKEKIKNSIPLSKFLISQIVKNNDLKLPEGRSNIQFLSKKVLKYMPNSLFKKQIIFDLEKITKVFFLKKKDKDIKNIKNIFKIYKKIIIILIVKPIIIKKIKKYILKIIKYKFSENFKFLLNFIIFYYNYNYNIKNKLNINLFFKKIIILKLKKIYFINRKKNRFFENEILWLIKKLKLKNIKKSI